MTTAAEAMERVKYFGGQELAMVVWCEDDVLGRAVELGIECSREQAKDIIATIDRKQDCELGITWDTIDCYLLEIY